MCACVCLFAQHIFRVIFIMWIYRALPLLCWCDIRFIGQEERGMSVHSCPLRSTCLFSLTYSWFIQNTITFERSNRIEESIDLCHINTIHLFILLSGSPIIEPAIFFLYLFSYPSVYLPYHAAKLSIYASICLSNNIVVSICLTLHCLLTRQSKLLPNYAVLFSLEIALVCLNLS